MFEDENNEVETSEETQEDVELESYEEDEIEQVEETEEEQIDWEARAKKAEQAIEKAKQKQKKAPQAVNANGLSTADIIALSRANIDDEDIEEVLDYAKYKKVSVAEALKSTVIKATLSEKAEIRKSAMAVNTGTGRRAGGAISDERLLADAEKGIMPDSDEDIARIARLRLKRK